MRPLTDRRRLARLCADLAWCAAELGDELTGHQRADLERAYLAARQLLTARGGTP